MSIWLMQINELQLRLRSPSFYPDLGLEIQPLRVLPLLADFWVISSTFPVIKHRNLATLASKSEAIHQNGEMETKPNISHWLNRHGIL